MENQKQNFVKLHKIIKQKTNRFWLTYDAGETEGRECFIERVKKISL